MAIARDNSIYIVEAYGQRLVKLDATGVPLWSVGEPGIRGGSNGENDHFNEPWGAAVDGTGRVYVADAGNNRIQTYDSGGAYYATLGGQWGTGSYQFACPQGVAFGPNGDLYVADDCNHRVQIFNRNLVYVATLGVAGVSGIDNAHFNRPGAIAVDSAGIIYVADTNCGCRFSGRIAPISAPSARRGSPATISAISRIPSTALLSGWPRSVTAFMP